jgi:copper chaperone CopZ
MNKTTTKKSQPITAGKVVHRIPGRMRVRIDRLHDDIRYSNDLQQTVNALTGVTEVRINPAASSIIITYQISQLPEQTVLDCLGVSLPVAKVARKPIEHPVTDELDAPPDGDFIASAEKLTAEITSEAIGESIGEIVGETVGELLMGPIGLAIGAEIGGKIGGEIGESFGNIVEESIEAKDSTEANPPPNPTELKPPPDRRSQKQPRPKNSPLKQ